MSVSCNCHSIRIEASAAPYPMRYCSSMLRRPCATHKQPAGHTKAIPRWGLPGYKMLLMVSCLTTRRHEVQCSIMFVGWHVGFFFVLRQMHLIESMPKTYR